MMLEQRELPRLNEIPTGWRLVRTGNSRIDDKYWVPALRAFLPLVGADMKVGCAVNLPDMPCIIRRDKEK